MKERIREILKESGAVAVGFASAAALPAEVMDSYRKWIGEGSHSGMDYLERHVPLKSNPRAVLDNVATVISVAFSYVPEELRSPQLPMIACYAYGYDYHDVIRQRLAKAVEQLKGIYGGDWHICIDSAPIAERYWAMKSGIGIKGLNGSVITPRAGSLSFLAEVLTSLTVAPDVPSEGICERCGRCVKACPTGALRDDGTVDSRRCLSYLTIEHRCEWDEEGIKIMGDGVGANTLFGCDICQRVCPHNKVTSPSGIPEFQPKEGMMTLSAEDIVTMDKEDFSRFFKGTAIKRAKFEGLQRNARNVLRHKGSIPDQIEEKGSK